MATVLKIDIWLHTTVKKKFFLFPVAFLLTVVGSLRADVAFNDLFHMTAAAAKSSLGMKRFEMLQAAADDFNATVNFKPPVHAKLDGVMADGGTSVYKGAGYRLTVTQRISSIGSGSKAVINGFMYGPVLDLGPELGGVMDSVSFSRVSFYPTKASGHRVK